MVTQKKPVIERYLCQEGEDWERIKRELKPLVKLINDSYDEYSLQLRENYFNIYYQGNSAAKVQKNKNGTYTVSIHQEFVKNGICEKLARYSLNKQSPKTTNNYARFRIEAQDIGAFFKKNHLDSISSKIRAVGNGEEITFEQVIVTDNPPSPDFIIIDRQVADHSNWARADLLALKRDTTATFHFVVIELKLGRNPELCEKAGKQVSDYVKHIRENMEDYVDCYQRNYEQKKQLGLFPKRLDIPEMPESISINRNTASVEGLVIACGYSRIADENIKSLNRAIERNLWDIKARQMPKMQLDKSS